MRFRLNNIESSILFQNSNDNIININEVLRATPKSFKPKNFQPKISHDDSKLVFDADSIFDDQVLSRITSK